MSTNERTVPVRKKAEHPVRDEMDEVQDVVDVRREINRCACEQLIAENLHRIEPIQRGGLAAKSHTLALVSLAEAPQSDLVKIMETQRLRNCIDQGKVGNRSRHNVAQVEAEKVPVLNDGFVAYTGNVNQDEEDEGDKEEKGGCESPSFAPTSGALDLLFAEFGDNGGRCVLRYSCIVGRAVVREEPHDAGGVADGCGACGYVCV